MMKAIRVPERAFSIAMWIVSFIFAGFLTGLGQLVIGDLPRVENPVEIGQFVDQRAAAKIQTARNTATIERDAIQIKTEEARPAAEAARNDYTAKREAFDNWIATRQATTDPKQDPEVISRTKELDTLNDKARAQDKIIEDLNAQSGTIERKLSQLDQDRMSLEAAAQSTFDSATFWQDLKVFVYFAAAGARRVDGPQNAGQRILAAHARLWPVCALRILCGTGALSAQLRRLYPLYCRDHPHDCREPLSDQMDAALSCQPRCR
jgi:hypothetical protein